MPISQTEGYFENPYCHFFRRTYAFTVGCKMKTLRKIVLNVKIKTNLSFAVKVTERSNHSFLLSIWWIAFFRHLYDRDVEALSNILGTIMELKELNWLCKHMKKVRSSQLCISMNFCTEFSKTQVFHVSIVKASWIYEKLLDPYFLVVEVLRKNLLPNGEDKLENFESSNARVVLLNEPAI